jgi:5,10-methylenetetrahydromethanopterin reductase
MRIGLLMFGDAPVQAMVERARLAEAVGYDTVWLADERFYCEVYSCWTHFAGHTSKVLLGPCVTDPFSRHPALTAMAIATLDEVSRRARDPGYRCWDFRVRRARALP